MIRRRSWAAGCATLTVAGITSLLLGGQAAFASSYDAYFRAIEVDNAAEVQALLARGLDPTTLDPAGQHGLFLAIRGGSNQVAKVLLQHPDTRVDAANATGETPLMMAALRANVGAMKALMARGAQVDRPGWTPLHYAASSPSAEPVRFLLEGGAAVDARAPNGNTALMLAARYGHELSVELLLGKGADRNLRNERGLNAADYARLDGRESLARRLASDSR
jgi:uncharacterized protein